MKYFTKDELKCKCGCSKIIINNDFLKKIEELRKFLDFPFIVNSYFRCEKHNKEIGGVNNSHHLTGNAIDIRANGVKALMIVENVTAFGIKGIGVYKTFIHLDDGGKNDEKNKRLRFWVGY